MILSWPIKGYKLLHALPKAVQQFDPFNLPICLGRVGSSKIQCVARTQGRLFLADTFTCLTVHLLSYSSFKKITFPITNWSYCLQILHQSLRCNNSIPPTAPPPPNMDLSFQNIFYINDTFYFSKFIGTLSAIYREHRKQKKGLLISIILPATSRGLTHNKV